MLFTSKTMHLHDIISNAANIICSGLINDKGLTTHHLLSLPSTRRLKSSLRSIRVLWQMVMVDILMSTLTGPINLLWVLGND